MAGNCVNCVDACFIRKIVGAYVAVQNTNRYGVSDSGRADIEALNAAVRKEVAKVAEALWMVAAGLSGSASNALALPAVQEGTLALVCQ